MPAGDRCVSRTSESRRLNQLDQCSADFVNFLIFDSIEKRREGVLHGRFLSDFGVLQFFMELLMRGRGMPSRTEEIQMKPPAAAAMSRATGPRSSAGKRRSSRNAIKPSPLSQYLILEGENRLDFENLHRALINDRRPRGTLENLLERLAIFFGARADRSRLKRP